MTQDEFDQLVADLFEVMYSHAGQGFAANQAGLFHQLFVINRAGKTWTFINPEVLEYGKRMSVADEACLSVPGILVPVIRPGTVKLKYFDSYDNLRRGKHTIQQYAGPMGRVVQHECDHLQGRLIIDLLSHSERDNIQPQLDKLIAGVTRGIQATEDAAVVGVDGQGSSNERDPDHRSEG
jgi:peptide deformylase